MFRRVRLLYEIGTGFNLSIRNAIYNNKRSHFASACYRTPLPSVLIAKNNSHCTVAAGHHEITAEELMKLVSSDSAQVIDVREPNETRETGMIPSATNIPLGEIETALAMTPEEFAYKYGSNKPKLDDGNIVFSCRAGVRSAKALEIAQKNGYLKARHLDGGFEAWASTFRIQINP